MISLIVAHSKNRVIGKNGNMCWSLPGDMLRFKKLTVHKPVIMGRKTYESIGKPLVNRLNIVLTRKPTIIEGCIVLNSVQRALDFVSGYEESFVIGGSEIYRQCLPYVDKMYITEIHKYYLGDAFFPEYNAKKWECIERIDHPQESRTDSIYTLL